VALPGTGGEGAALAGVVASAGPFNAVLNQCAQDRDLASALHCVGAMKEAGIPLDLLRMWSSSKLAPCPHLPRGFFPGRTSQSP